MWEFSAHIVIRVPTWTAVSSDMAVWAMPSLSQKS